MPLTDTAIRSAKFSEKPIRMFGAGGLFLEVSLAGGKWWRLKYRIDGKEERLALGAHPDTGLRDARDRRDKVRKLLAGGVGPGEHRKATKHMRAEQAANSLEPVAREWYAKTAPAWRKARRKNHSGALRWTCFPDSDTFQSQFRRRPSTGAGSQGLEAKMPSHRDCC